MVIRSLWARRGRAGVAHVRPAPYMRGSGSSRGDSSPGRPSRGPAPRRARGWRLVCSIIYPPDSARVVMRTPVEDGRKDSIRGPWARWGGQGREPRVRHADLGHVQSGPTPRTPGDRAHRLGEVSPPTSAPCRVQPVCVVAARPAHVRWRGTPAGASPCLARVGQRLTSPAGCVSSHTPTASTARTPHWLRSGAEQPHPAGRGAEAQRPHPTAGTARTPLARARGPLAAQQPHPQWPRERPHVRERSRVTPMRSAGVTRRRQSHNPLTLRGLLVQTGARCLVSPRATE